MGASRAHGPHPIRGSSAACECASNWPGCAAPPTDRIVQRTPAPSPPLPARSHFPAETPPGEAFAASEWLTWVVCFYSSEPPLSNSEAERSRPRKNPSIPLPKPILNQFWRLFGLSAFSKFQTHQGCREEL